MSLRDDALEPIPTCLPDEAQLLERMVGLASLALRAGVSLSYEDWEDMDWTERRAWIAAGDVHAARSAQRLGLATQGPLGAALCSAEVDDYAAADRIYMEAFTRAALAREEGAHE
jgi:hypothetical protein